MEIKGQIFAGESGSILIRQKSGEKIEIGDLLIAEGSGYKILLQVFNLKYGSQINQQNLELMTGLQLEGYKSNTEFLEKELRSYIIAEVKAIAEIRGSDVRIPKVLPEIFSEIRLVDKNDLSFLSKPENPLYIGKVRSGSKKIDVDVFLNSEDAFSHHILIPATTGRGKSNLVKVMLWSVMGQNHCGILVLDAHNEYYEEKTKGIGLRYHNSARDNLVYYSLNPQKGGASLSVNIKLLKPFHFSGIITLTEAQERLMYFAHSHYNENWISKLLLGDPEEDPENKDSVFLEGENFNETTLAIVRQRLTRVLGIEAQDNTLVCNGVFTKDTAGESTIKNIVEGLSNGKKIIVDTSTLPSQTELLIGSVIANDVFNYYKNLKTTNQLKKKPVISIVIEEAPRVIGRDVLKQGDNIYGTIAREGRKFKVGLTAITQLTSEIPREILANMNTKIILGNEMKMERESIIESAAQDLSDDNKTIASLGKGEAIVSSVFTKFAIPVAIPEFNEEYTAKESILHEKKLGLVK